jgi:Ca-activated chloride channel family protein
MNNKTLLRIALSFGIAMMFHACTAPESPRSNRNAIPHPKSEEHKAAQVRPPVARETTEADTSGSAARDTARRQAQSAARRKPVPAPMMERALVTPARGVPPGLRPPSESVDRENYTHFTDNPVKLVAEHPVSTFSIDVDTGAYANVRRFLNSGRLPRHDAVRVEEMINYFKYDYPLPTTRKQPFRVITEIAPAPWDGSRHLLHIGIKGYDVPPAQLPPSNLVFLVDVSGSMRTADKLDLLKSSIKLLAERMDKRDRITLVVYAGASGVVLPPTPGNNTGTIVAALDSLAAGGRTNGAAGIRLAYAMAEQAYIKGGINRVILATDGDFNVGTVSFETLKKLVAAKRKSGITLTALGFGSGNYNDHLMEQLADAGNGNYAYIDTLNEANKVLVSEMSSTLFTIAKDVKVQIEFNPAVVGEYRLIGYENRMLKREDFNNDKVDAGDIGAGHSVTALYEVALEGKGRKTVDPLRYVRASESPANHAGELAFLKLRYKVPHGNRSKLINWPIRSADISTDITRTSNRFRFSAAVAGFGQLLRGGKYSNDFSYKDVLALARNSRGQDRYGYRGEFIRLVSLADTLSSHRTVSRNGKARLTR